MTRIRMVGRALTVVIAIIAVATAAAEAAENPVLAKPNGEAITNVTATGLATGEAFAESSGGSRAKVECSSSEGTGTVSTTLSGTGETSGIGTVTLKGCKTSAFKCANRGTSEITGTVATLLVWLGKESAKTVGILTYTAPQSATPGNGKGGLLSFKCSGELVDVEGGFLSLVNRTLNQTFTEGTATARQSDGIQQDKTYAFNGIEGTDSRFSNEGGNSFSQLRYEGEGEGEFSTVVKIIEN
jgi:hypothetical protein